MVKRIVGFDTTESQDGVGVPIVRGAKKDTPNGERGRTGPDPRTAKHTPNLHEDRGRDQGRDQGRDPSVTKEETRTKTDLGTTMDDIREDILRPFNPTGAKQAIKNIRQLQSPVQTKPGGGATPLHPPQPPTHSHP